MIRKIQGPYRDKSNGVWRLRWVEDGRNRTFARKSKSEVEDKRRELLGHQGEVKVDLGQLPDFTGKPGWFQEAFGHALAASAAAVVAGDSDTLARLRKHISNLRDVAQSWVAYSGLAELEDKFDELLSFFEQTQRQTYKEGVPFGEHQPGVSESLRSAAGPDALEPPDGEAMEKSTNAP